MNKDQVISQIQDFCPIDADTVTKLEQFVDALISYNQKYNLIGESTEKDVWHRHVLDSAQLMCYIDNHDVVIGDFGCGAGFPGLVLSILGVKEVHLIEKSFRKCEFLQLASQFSANKIVIHQKRAEEIDNLKLDIAVSRAFSPLNKLLAIVKPFLKESGSGIFLKGKSFNDEIILAKKINKFHYVAHPSLTSEQSRVVIINNIN